MFKNTQIGTRKATGITEFFTSPFRGSIYGSSTMLQAERSLVQILMRSMDFLNLPNRSSLIIALGLNQPPTEISTTNIPSG
jgi:hypothetical protein